MLVCSPVKYVKQSKGIIQDNMFVPTNFTPFDLDGNPISLRPCWAYTSRFWILAVRSGPLDPEHNRSQER